MQELPLVPRNLDVALEDEARAEGLAHEEPPPATTGTSRGDKAKGGRGQHGRHKKDDTVWAIEEVGPCGEPLRPLSVIGKYSNQCSVLVREKVDLTYTDWKKVPEGLKQYVWDAMKERFNFPEGYNEAVCRQHCMVIAGKALRTFRFNMNKDYVKTGKNPCIKYNYIRSTAAASVA